MATRLFNYLTVLVATEPVRVYGIVTALVTVFAYYLPSNGWPLILGFLAAVLGVGETARSMVTPLVRPRLDDHTPLIPDAE